MVLPLVVPKGRRKEPKDNAEVVNKLIARLASTKVKICSDSNYINWT